MWDHRELTVISYWADSDIAVSHSDLILRSLCDHWELTAISYWDYFEITVSSQRSDIKLTLRSQRAHSDLILRSLWDHWELTVTSYWDHFEITQSSQWFDIEFTLLSLSFRHKWSFKWHCNTRKIHLPDKGFWAWLGDLAPDMPRQPETWVLLCNLMLKRRGISRRHAILGSDSPPSHNRKGNSIHSLWKT